MANTVLVIGESGTGKSTSIRNLDPKETFIINVVGKALPFRGYKSKYTNISPDWTTGNYVACDEAEKIIKAIEFINGRRPDIKNIIIDDFQYTMANEFMRKAVEKGYEKFTKIGQNAWMIINALSRCRDDLECFVLSHSEIDVNGKVKCKTIGKMLDDKITLEGMFTIVLHTIVEAGNYRFLTQNDGVHIAKSPMGMFEDKYIANDLQYVKQHIADYMNEDIAL
jgi:ABC-type dipeptide/oligopeptide/nickel transport system ATPase component